MSTNYNFHQYCAHLEEALRGCSGITSRLAMLLWVGAREHERQRRPGPYAPRHDVFAVQMGCSRRSIVRAYKKLQDLGVIQVIHRWRRWGVEAMRQLSSTVIVLFDPEKGKERRAMAMTRAEQLRKLKAMRNSTVPPIQARQTAFALEVRGLPKATALSNALVEKGLHPVKCDKPVPLNTSILYSEKLLTSLTKKGRLWKDE